MPTIKSILLQISCIFIAFFISDLISALTHCLVIDNSYTENSYTIENGILVINTDTGYASCHHIFPSNWKDISDTTIYITMFLFLLIPQLFIYFFIKNNYIKFTLNLIILFIILSPIAHKYAHEKIHNRDIPYIYNLLISYGLFLNPNQHRRHHIENNYNWSFLNGISDIVFNNIVKTICNFFNICPYEKTLKSAKLLNSNGEIIRVKFIGDIDGEIKCKVINNLFIRA